MTDPVDDVLRKLSNIVSVLLVLTWLAALGYLAWKDFS